MVEQALGFWAALEAGLERVWQRVGDLWLRVARAVPVVGRVGAFIAEVTRTGDAPLIIVSIGVIMTVVFFRRM